MGFYNIMLEGQQADKYLADKARVQREKEKKDFERSERRLNKYENIIGEPNAKDPNDSQEKREKDAKRVEAASKVSDRRLDWENDQIMPGKVRASNMDPVLAAKLAHQSEIDKPMSRKDAVKINHQLGFTDDMDAIEKHMRRHPDQWDGDKRIKTRSESGIFESVEFLNEGDYADVYKARKEKEAKELEREERSRLSRRSGKFAKAIDTDGMLYTNQDPKAGEGKLSKEAERSEKALDATYQSVSKKHDVDDEEKMLDPKYRQKVSKELINTYDAYDKHYRRHPEKMPKDESAAIFNNIKII